MSDEHLVITVEADTDAFDKALKKLTRRVEKLIRLIEKANQMSIDVSVAVDAPTKVDIQRMVAEAISVYGREFEHSLPGRIADHAARRG